MHDRVWEEMKIYGDKGGSSIRGEAEKQEKVCEGDVCHNNISELSLWSVSWVGNRPANPEATVTQVAAAKEQEPIKVTKQVTLDEVEGMLEKIIARRGKKYCLFAKKDIDKDINLGISHIFHVDFENGYIRTPLGGFINYSDKPNCKIFMTPDGYNLITNQKITTGEELTLKYNLYNPTKP